MDNQRLFLFLALSLVLWLLWQAWDAKQHPPTPAVAPSATQAPGVPSSSVAPSAPSLQSVPPEAPTPVATVPAASLKSGQRVHVVTDLVDAEIDTIGGDLRRLDLIRYPLGTDKRDQPFRLLNDSMPNLFVAQSGVVTATGVAPDAEATYQADQAEYRLPEGADSIDVKLVWSHPSGTVVTKTYTFRRNSYVVDLKIDVSNQTATEWKGRVYRQLQRTKVAEPGQSSFIYTYMGGIVSSERNKYEKVEFEDMQNWKPQDSFYTGGWAAMLQHYFLGAWIPPKDQLNHYYTNVLDQTRYVIGLMSEELAVAPGASATMTSQLYVGPKEQHRLEQAALNLKLTVDYGVLTVIAQPLFWLLEFFHGVIGNWGWAIVALTVLIKLVFYKLSETSYKSMANMRRMQPKMQAIRERYGDDRQRMSQALMDLYKKEKINPLGGCLPILVQVPVFIALYWVLLESVELRQAGFLLWIDDLAAKDPYYVLPILMSVTMWFQQKLNPPVPDPVQQKIMMALPFIFLLFFAFFPSGLVLYWVVNNILSIAQQWYITRKIERAAGA